MKAPQKYFYIVLLIGKTDDYIVLLMHFITIFSLKQADNTI